MNPSRIFLFLWPSFILFGLGDSALAYIDPGSGSMLLQLLLGGIAGVGVVLKLYWRQFIGLFRRSSPKDPESFSSEDQKL